MLKKTPNLQRRHKTASDSVRRKQNSKHILVAVPKDYLLGPVFAAKKQDGARKVQIGDVVYEIGGVHPFDEPGKMAANKPALDVRHARAIFTLLSIRDPADIDGTRTIRISFDELCRRYINGDSVRNAREIPEIVGDLLDTYICVTNLKTNKSLSYRMIDRIDFEDGQPHQRGGKGCELSSEFCGFLNRLADLAHLKFDVFTAIRSPLAQAIYLYIPGWASHHTERAPFQITLTNLLTQVSYEVPVDMAGRRTLFTRGKNSILKQLDGVETMSGRFRVRLTKTADGSDWTLQAWVEN